MLKPLITAALLAFNISPAQAEFTEYLCYRKLPSGVIENLDYLCNGQSKVTQKVNQDLQLVNVSLKRRMEFSKFITVVTGSIVNNSGKSINYPNISYSTYRKNSEGLTEQESDKEFTKKLTLRPSESSNFEVKLTKSFDVFMIDFIDSVQIQDINIKACYAGGLESSGYCNLLSPISIQRFN